MHICVHNTYIYTYICATFACPCLHAYVYVYVCIYVCICKSNYNIKQRRTDAMYIYMPSCTIIKRLNEKIINTNERLKNNSVFQNVRHAAHNFEGLDP